MTYVNRRLSVAPMIDWTTKHCRYFHRQLSPNALLYTEMVTTGALLFGDLERHLSHHISEQPVALQLGGSDPAALAKCAALGQQWGYNEINLNCGCPSDRVQSGAFGACLMASPALVADSVCAMKAATDLPVTVKCRIGIDDQDEYQDLQRFTEALANAEVDALIVHARKAWLQGLSPKQNREVPPLNYPRVYQLKADFPEIPMIINGGITEWQAIETHLERMDGVMIGRAAYQSPYWLAELEHRLFNSTPPEPRAAYVRRLFPYIEQHLAGGGRLNHITRHILGLYQGQPGGKQFRRILSEQTQNSCAGIEVLEQALSVVEAHRVSA